MTSSLMDGEANAERDRLVSELAPLRECREALSELVALKDGPRDANYEARKPEVWERARMALRWTDGD
jgi:hypothetical protein